MKGTLKIIYKNSLFDTIDFKFKYKTHFYFCMYKCIKHRLGTITDREKGQRRVTTISEMKWPPSPEEKKRQCPFPMIELGNTPHKILYKCVDN